MSKSVKKKLIIIITALVFVIAIIFVFKVDNVNVSGNEICTKEEITEHYTKGLLGDNALVIYLKDKLGAYNNIPFVRDVDITVKSRNTITIQVYEKALVACFYYMGEYVYFDKDGMILETSKEKSEALPCIEGISFTGFALNGIIELENEQQIDMILDLSELISHYKVQADRVVFSNKNEVTLYCGEIKVFLGNQELYDQQIASVSDVIRKALKNNLSGTIDLKDYNRGDKIILKKNQ
ncbi:MAG: hypothetical protein E7267_05670 [Lachnospiraceae bacterium]|nr:hypothetical protein [Lachnospiraceae bacterium]